MFDFLLALTGLTLAAATLLAYRSSRDVLHPMMFIGPLFFMGTVLDPLSVSTQIHRFFFSIEDVNVVLLLNLLSVAAFAFGTLRRVRPALLHQEARKVGSALTEAQAVAIRRVSTALAGWAMASYSYGIANAGGFIAAFSRAKGGGHAGSGYISEGMNLGLVAAAMVALSRYRRGMPTSSLVVVAVGLLPNAVQGTFGGRRGPLFLCMAAATLVWFMTRTRPPKLWTVWPALALTAVAVMFVASQRQFLYIGSAEGVSWEKFRQALAPEKVDQGNNFIYGAGFVLTTRHAGEFTWGKETAVNLFVRPVPKQLWPSKYEDVGATWVTSQFPGLGHVMPADWLAAVGWLPLAGSSAISVSDLFGEFGWGTVLVFYLIGRAFGELNYRRRTRGGMWLLLYLEALVLSVYLATQSFSAFYHRYLILAVPTIIVWKKFIERPPKAVRRSARFQYRPVASRSAY